MLTKEFNKPTMLVAKLFVVIVMSKHQDYEFLQFILLILWSVNIIAGHGQYFNFALFGTQKHWLNCSCYSAIGT
jgi:hypothetical protein